MNTTINYFYLFFLHLYIRIRPVFIIINYNIHNYINILLIIILKKYSEKLPQLTKQTVKHTKRRPVA